MRTKKICMIGSFAVGKTSLISRYVHHQFSADYLTTIGVKIDTKELALRSGDHIKLVLWDMAGTDSLITTSKNYLQGAAGYILVADGTRSASLEAVVSMQNQVERILGPTPFTLMLNKIDLKDQWAINPDDVNSLTSKGWKVLHCSAKTGDEVETAFQTLGERMMVEIV